MRLALPLTIAALLAAPLVAQSMQTAPAHMMPGTLKGAGTPASVKAGSYAVEPAHTQVHFAVSHMGISPYDGWFSGASGTLTIDPARPAATTLSVSIPIASVQTTSDKLTEELKSADWLDAGRFAAATFTSTGVTRTGADTATIRGNLTLHGVTRPVSMDARLFGAAANPMSKKDSLGFTGRLVIKRSEFGVAKYVPLVSDETVLVINAAFEKQ